MPCVYDLPELPADVVLMLPENVDNESVTKWSGSYPIPKIGDRVRIGFNELGSGAVESYFVEHGFVGVCVKLDNPPAWKRKQHAGTKHEDTALVFGKEITLEVKS